MASAKYQKCADIVDAVTDAAGVATNFTPLGLVGGAVAGVALYGIGEGAKAVVCPARNPRFKDLRNTHGNYPSVG